MLSIKAKKGGEMMEKNHSTMTTRMTSMPMGEWSGTSASSSNAAIDIAIVVADDGWTTTRDGVGSTHEAEEDSTTRCVGVCGGCAVVIDVRDDSAMGPPLSVEEGTRHDMEGGQSSAIDRWRTTRMIVARVTSLQPPPPPLDRRGRGGHR